MILESWKPEGVINEEEEKELKEDEIKHHTRILKNGKAAGIDEIPKEAWIYMQGKTEQELCNLDNQKEPLITPLYKKLR